MAAVTICSDFGAQKNSSALFACVPPSTELRKGMSVSHSCLKEHRCSEGEKETVKENKRVRPGYEGRGEFG